jgi:hypothetical protein
MALNSRPVPYYMIESPLSQGIRAIALPHGLTPDDPVMDRPGREGRGMGNVHVRMGVVLTGMLVVGLALVLLFSQNVNIASGDGVSMAAGGTESSSASETGGAAGVLSSLFTREVLYWEPQIVAWSALYGVDPNLAAIIMQIESCGDPGAVSGAGAQGLFQVMPFHFAAGENPQDPDTNAARGLRYFADRLVQTNGDIGRAFAGYNGGHVAAAASWDSWANETQRYYLWSTGIYSDIMSGGNTSETLDRWLAAGGAGLCQQAAARLGI